VVRFSQYLQGALEHVLVKKVENFIILIDFILTYIKEDDDVPIFLGRPFLAIARTIIDMEGKKIYLSFDKKKKKNWLSLIFFYKSSLSSTNKLLCGGNCIYHVIWEDFLRSTYEEEIAAEKEFDEGRILSPMDQTKFWGRNGQAKEFK